MNNELSENHIKTYRDNGFVLVEDFLSAEELKEWREAVAVAVKERAGRKFPNQDIVTGEDDGINPDADYYGKVFDQLLNLWMTNERIKNIMFDERIGRMAAELSGEDGIRIWHDQALIKQPWANPTGWHLDTPFWSFSHREALSIWVALDDVTLENGCLFFIPGSHKKTSFENPGITKNMDAVFDFYPEFKNSPSVPVVMKAGSCSFHNGLCIHGAHANMTPGLRRAMTCAYMPDGSLFNGEQNVLSDEQVARLKIGDPLNDDAQNPLIYSR